jgi:hypothetical protein
MHWHDESVIVLIFFFHDGRWDDAMTYRMYGAYVMYSYVAYECRTYEVGLTRSFMTPSAL